MLHEAKMPFAVNKQYLTTKDKQAQITLIDSTALNTLLTGIELHNCNIENKTRNSASLSRNTKIFNGELTHPTSLLQ